MSRDTSWWSNFAKLLRLLVYNQDETRWAAEHFFRVPPESPALLQIRDTVTAMRLLALVFERGGPGKAVVHIEHGADGNPVNRLELCVQAITFEAAGLDHEPKWHVRGLVMGWQEVHTFALCNIRTWQPSVETSA